MTDLVLSRRAVVVDDWDLLRFAAMLGDYPRFFAEGEALAQVVDQFSRALGGTPLLAATG